MKKSVLSLLFLIIMNSTFSFAQNNFDFKTHWEEVDQLARQQLPESALKAVEIIMNEAINTNNFNETVKAYIYKMRFTLEKDPDAAAALLKEFESFKDRNYKPGEKALIHSMTAELYAMYYQQNQYIINQRSQITGYIPEDINEWSKNIFYDKIAGELKHSLENPGVLQKSDISAFNTLIEKGNDAAEYQPTLFDFLAYRAITILQNLTNIAPVKNPLNSTIYFLPATEFIKIKPEEKFAQSKENLILDTYRQLLEFHIKDNNVPALVYADLQRLNYVRNVSEYYDADIQYENALLALQQKYYNNEAVVEVMEQLACFYMNQRYNMGEENTLYKKKAYEIVRSGIEKYPSYKRIGILKVIETEILQKSIIINYPSFIAPKNELTIQTSSTNIHTLELNVYRVEATAQEYYSFRQNGNNRKMPYPQRNLIETREININTDENFGEVKNDIKLTASGYGIYEFTIDQKDDNSEMEQIQGAFTVSNYTFIQRQTEKNKTSLYVLDRRSGEPVSGVEVEIFYYEWDGRKTVAKEGEKKRTAKDGSLQISNERYSNVFFLSKGDDRYFCSRADNYFYSEPVRKETNTLALFTDRSLYRPGQTIYFKGIAYSSKEQEVVKNASFEVKLLDTNSQEVSKKTFKTNEFGSFSGEFILPEDGLNSMFQLQNEFGNVSFYVEEYKRPTFEVNIEKTEKEVHFGEKVIFYGNVRAYSGYSVSNAQVEYKVVRNSHPLFWWNRESSRIVASGLIESNAKGDFEVEFIPERSQNKSSFFRESFYTYTITVNVTDSKGETQQGFQSVSVGDKSLFIIQNIPQIYDKETTFSVRIYTETLNGKVNPSIISYTLYSLDNESEFHENISDLSKLKVKRQVLSGTHDTKNEFLKLDLSKLESGYYRFVSTTSDSQGKEVRTESTFILYSSKEKRPPVKTYNWFEVHPATELQYGETAQIRFGSSEKISLLYEIAQGNKILESKRIIINNEIKTFRIPFNKSYGEGITVMFTFLKDEKLYTNQQQFRRKADIKSLSPRLSIFRDKLKPGETADWTVTIPETADEKMLAELMIDMYDASLDAIRPHYWNFYPTAYIQIPYTPAWNARGLDSAYDQSYSRNRINNAESISIDRLNWFGLNFYNYSYGARPVLMRGAGKTAGLQVDEEIFEVADNAGMLQESVVVPSPVLKKESYIEMPEEQVQIRTNFNETAFFYPQLKTDKDGNVKFSFTVPESLTRWNIKMLAHTPGLYYGEAQAQVETQKDLMVQLNMPRFVRNSDKLTLRANVINLTGKTLTAKVKFELINPETEQIITIKDNQIKTIILDAQETKSVEWDITEFTGYELVIAKVIAQAGEFSDGEQHYLPVLPDKILVTESLPLTVRSNETRNFRFDNLLRQAKAVESQNLTIEFASNPTWYAIQALPTLSAPEYENAIDYFTAYYVNSLAAYIANSNPEIAAVFERWKREGGSREALLSNLEKNKELKNMLLGETPWVLAAKDEAEQKRQIALLFDLNQQQNQSQQYLNKLINLQKPSGGFSWFDGMNESRYITQEILLGMARYNKMTHYSPTPDWLVKALNYIDLQIAKDLNNLKNSNKDYKNKMVIGDMQWFYLHVRSGYKDVPVREEAEEAVEFYTAQAEKYWTNASLYGKTATALISYRNDNTALANNILKSLKENAIKSDEIGMYWAHNTPGYFWNERPVSVQTAILEAFAEVTNSQSDIDEMKIWLLKQKQTQSWDSPISTVDAIYSLLYYGTDWLTGGAMVEIKLDNQLLEPKVKEAGTGYFKETIPGHEVTPQLGNVSVSLASPSGRSGGTTIGWGAMYWQYYQDTDKVQEQGNSLSVTKSMFVEKTENNISSLLPIEQIKLQKGDKIITRLVIRTDRNLEYVVLKDLRPAGLEPVDQRSGMIWREGISYYQTTKDASTQFYFNFLSKGTYVFEYESWANNSGEFINGITSIQCMYTPEFVGHSKGSKITIE